MHAWGCFVLDGGVKFGLIVWPRYACGIWFLFYTYLHRCHPFSLSERGRGRGREAVVVVLFRMHYARVVSQFGRIQREWTTVIASFAV